MRQCRQRLPLTVKPSQRSRRSLPRKPTQRCSQTRPDRRTLQKVIVGTDKTPRSSEQAESTTGLPRSAILGRACGICVRSDGLGGDAVVGGEGLLLWKDEAQRALELARGAIGSARDLDLRVGTPPLLHLAAP